MNIVKIKSAVLEGNKNIVIKNLPSEEILSDECEVTIDTAGLCSSDIARGCIEGAYFYPLVMGHELSGTITKVGDNDTDNLVIGDRVSIFPLLPCFKCSSCKNKLYALCSDYDYYGSRRNGGFTQKLNVKKWNLLKLPDGVSLEDGALTEPTAVALHAIKKLEIDPDDSVKLALIGAGFLGLIAVQLINKFYPKCEITLIDRNRFKLVIGQKFDALPQKIDGKESWEKFIVDNENKFDRVIEFAGAAETFSGAIHIASPSARVIWAGNISDDLTLSKSQVSSILRKEITIIGTWNSIYKGLNVCDWTESLELISKGLKPSELVSLRIGLDEIGQTLGKLFAHKNRDSKFEVIKVLVKPNG